MHNWRRSSICPLGFRPWRAVIVFVGRVEWTDDACIDLHLARQSHVNLTYFLTGANRWFVRCLDNASIPAEEIEFGDGGDGWTAKWITIRTRQDNLMKREKLPALCNCYSFNCSNLYILLESILYFYDVPCLKRIKISYNSYCVFSQALILVKHARKKANIKYLIQFTFAYDRG